VDVEHTIEFILDVQAKQSGHMEAIDQRMDGITKLIQQGMRLLLDNKTETDRKINALIDGQLRTEANVERLSEAQTRIDAKFEQLAEAHKATEQALKAFIDSLRQGNNGH